MTSQHRRRRPLAPRVGKHQHRGCLCRFRGRVRPAEADMHRAVRVRYAPSPTGFLHLGGLRTALYNYVFAKANNGTFILRIEDTDRSRQVPGSIEGLIRALKWCGLSYDEGPPDRSEDLSRAGVHANLEQHSDQGRGNYGPYIQSQRLSLYKQHADELLTKGHAYRCFCSKDRLDAARDARAKKGLDTLYDRACTHVGDGEAERRAGIGEPHVVRLRIPSGTTVLHDEVLGEVKFNNSVVDDQVLLKSDGFPTYHLASVVDDHAMEISHVIRGQEWLSSTPKHLILYNAFGWQPPAFAHLPLLLNTDKSKLSKRHGDAAVEDFIASGYLPEALVNFVALLGWTPPVAQKLSTASSASSASVSAKPTAGGPQPATGQPQPTGEVMSLHDMTRSFDFKNVQKGNAVVTRHRLDFFNGEHIKRRVVAALELSRPAAAPAVEPGAAAAPAKGNKSGKQSKQHGPLLVKDTPQLAELRLDIVKRLDDALQQLRVGDRSSNAGVASSSQRFSVEHLNACIAAQHEKVSLVSDFVSLLLPFVADPTEFELLIGGAEGQGTAVRMLQHGRTGGKHAKSGPDSASSSPAPAQAEPQLPPIDPSTAAAELVRPATPALISLVAEWEKLDGSAFASGSGFDTVKAVAKACGLPLGQMLLPLRFALTALDVGCPMGDTIGLLGRQTCLQRLKAAIATATAAQ